MEIAGYYKRFVKNFGQIAKPLTALLKANGNFRWSEAAEQAFNKLKQALVSAPVLALLDFSMELVVETDISRMAIGAVLM